MISLDLFYILSTLVILGFMVIIIGFLFVFVIVNNYIFENYFYNFWKRKNYFNFFMVFELVIISTIIYYVCVLPLFDLIWQFYQIGVF